MARITVEDCIDAIPDRFELVLLAAERARALRRGAPSDLTPDRDKRPVIALREIASGTIEPEELRNDYIAKFRQIDEDDLPNKVSDQFEAESIIVPDHDTSWQDNGFESRCEDMEASEIQDEDPSRQDNSFQSIIDDMENMPDDIESHAPDFG